MSRVKLVWVTPDAERIMGYCARVSSSNQDNPEVAGLLRYCITHGHWSVFEMASMCVEITTSRGISAQILRHRSFSFQEFSQRYAEVPGFEEVEPRRQHHKNRQGSIDDLPSEHREWFAQGHCDLVERATTLYYEALERGIAKESARFLLPMSAQTRLYMVGSVRSWVHYLQVRCVPDTQAEHREIAEAAKRIFVEQFPIVSEALEWGRDG